MAPWHFAKLQSAAESWDDYLKAASAFNARVGQEISYLEVATTAIKVLNFVQAYCGPENWHNDSPIFPFPRELADDVARHMEILISGHIPPWMIHLQKRGAPKRDPRVDTAICVALLYNAHCVKGFVFDKHPIKTIAEKFGVSRRAVEMWVKKYGAPPDEQIRADGSKHAVVAFDKWAAFYKAWGRGPKNERQKAGRRRPAKRPAI